MSINDSVVVVRAMGIIKELYDATIGTTGFDFLDLIADELGVALGRGL